MKRWILAFAIAAVASIVVAATASADVARYQSQTATFTVTQPAGQVGQWTNLWTHDYKVTVNPCDGTFTGIGNQYGNNDPQTYTEKITGTFGKDSVTFTTLRSDGVSWTLDTAKFGGAVTLADVTPNPGWPVEMKVTTPVFTNTSSFKNHGEYVSSQGGGADAAHSCIGMPINSNR